MSRRLEYGLKENTSASKLGSLINAQALSLASWLAEETCNYQFTKKFVPVSVARYKGLFVSVGT